MIQDTKFDVAGSLVEELADQAIDTTGAEAAGGLWTVPGTSTIGRVCTISWECQGFVCGWGW